MNRIFVTGITGKSGRAFLAELQKEQSVDRHYTFVARSEESCSWLRQSLPGCSVVKASLDDKRLIYKEIVGGGYNTLFHIAGIRYSPDLVKAALDSRTVRRIVLVHTTGIYSKYKAAGEDYRNIEDDIQQMLYGKNVSLTILRPTMIYGSLNDHNVSVFMKMVYKLRLFPLVNGGRYELQPVWCIDLGKAYYKVLQHPETTFNRNYVLSGGEPILLIDMLKVMGAQLNVKNQFFSVPFWLVYSCAYLVYLLTFGKVDFREKVQRLVEDRAYSHEDATRDFDYSPLKFEDGVKKEIEEFLKKNKN